MSRSAGPGAGGQAAARAATRRVFFALWPGEEERAALAQATRKAVRHCGGRPVPAQNLHVTLAFLGSVAEERIIELAAVARRAAAAFAAARPALTFDRLAHWTRPQLLCALGGDAVAAPATAPATLLAAAIRDGSVAAGFAPDLKPFRPHVTVARKVTHAPALQELAEIEWRFAGFALVDSRTAPSGPAYSVIDSYLLVNARKSR